MLILAKAALGLGATMALAGVFVFHEGVIRVDVDEHRTDGSHVHFWVPATVLSVGLHFVPKDQLNRTKEQVRPFLPAPRVDQRVGKVSECRASGCHGRAGSRAGGDGGWEFAD